MGRRAFSRVALLVVFTCATIFACGSDDDDDADRGDDAGLPVLQCVPNSLSRCLCELQEGLQRCDDAGRLGPCACGGDANMPRCGDGVVDDGEACDDGNLDDGDGCSAGCVPDGRPPAVEQCPGQGVVLGSKVHLSFELVGATKTTFMSLSVRPSGVDPSDDDDDAGTEDAGAEDAGAEDAGAEDATVEDAASDADAGDAGENTDASDSGVGASDSGPDAGDAGREDAGACGGTPDRVLSLLPTTSGELTISVTASIPTFVSLRAVCGSAAGASCEQGPAGRPVTFRLDVTRGQPVYLQLEPTEASPTATFFIDVMAP